MATSNPQPEKSTVSSMSTTNSLNKERSKTSLSSFLPPWVVTNISSWHSWKQVIRCCIASWAAFILILPTKSLNTLGNAGFFTVFASIFLPANFPVQLFLFLTSTLVLGLCLGWAFGAAAMRAGLAVRDQAALQAAFIQLQNSTAYAESPSLATASAVFHGQFLDTRSSVIYGVFLAFGVWVFSLSRAYAPKLAFFSIFGMIGIDVFATIGPLFPTSEYALLNSFLISTGCYAGIAFVCTMLIFPETMNHMYLNGVVGQLRRVNDMVRMQDEVLSASGCLDVGKFKAKRTAVLASQNQLMAQAAFLSLEFSWGRWNGDDVKEILEPLMLLVGRVSSLQVFSKLVTDTFEVIEENDPETDVKPSNISSSSSHADSYLLRQMHHRRVAIESERGVRMVDMLPVVEAATIELREGCIAGIDAVIAYLDHINRCRWHRHTEQDRSLVEAVEAAREHVEKELKTFKVVHRLKLLEPYTNLVEQAISPEDKDALPLRTLYISFVFSSNLISLGESLVGLMEFTGKKADRRRGNRLWAPKGLRAIWKALAMRGDDNDAVLGEDPSVAVKQEEEIATSRKDEEVGCVNYARDPDSRPPSNMFQKIMHALHAIYQWSKGPESIFAIKVAFVSVALWLPSQISRSAYFYYDEKGLWALIMAQTTINIFVADQIFNLIIRLAGTFLGLVLGLVTWYIGDGNPYGEAAIVAVIFIPTVFVRLFIPPQYLTGAIMTGVTWILVVGFSWVDGHYTQFASPGIGWSIAWKRFVLVSVGCTASFIMMMCPPTSGRKAVRRRNAASITSLSRLYGLLVSSWVQGKPMKEFRAQLLVVAEEINGIRQLTHIAQWEGGILGAWPYDSYLALVERQSDMLGALAQFASALNNLDDEWKVTFSKATKALNPHFISDVISIFTIVSQSLSNGSPLPQVLPTALLERLIYHHYVHRTTQADEENVMQYLHSLHYMYYATGIIALHQMLEALDEIHGLARDLCGEVRLEGWEEWREAYEKGKGI